MSPPRWREGSAGWGAGEAGSKQGIGYERRRRSDSRRGVGPLSVCAARGGSPGRLNTAYAARLPKGWWDVYELQRGPWQRRECGDDASVQQVADRRINPGRLERDRAEKTAEGAVHRNDPWAEKQALPRRTLPLHVMCVLYREDNATVVVGGPPAQCRLASALPSVAYYVWYNPGWL